MLDRPRLILDIFATHAARRGKLQVELAQYKYCCHACAANGSTLNGWWRRRTAGGGVGRAAPARRSSRPTGG